MISVLQQPRQLAQPRRSLLAFQSLALSASQPVFAILPEDSTTSTGDCGKRTHSWPQWHFVVIFSNCNTDPQADVSPSSDPPHENGSNTEQEFRKSLLAAVYPSHSVPFRLPTGDSTAESCHSSD